MIEPGGPVDEMDDAKLREVVALADYYPPLIVERAKEELLKRETHPRRREKS